MVENVTLLAGFTGPLSEALPDSNQELTIAGVRALGPDWQSLPASAGRVSSASTSDEPDRLGPEGLVPDGWQPTNRIVPTMIIMRVFRELSFLIAVNIVFGFGKISAYSNFFSFSASAVWFII
jgi:hypothetical protein